jgi:hypothetical protein
MRRFLFCLLLALSLVTFHAGCKKEKIPDDPMKVKLPPPTQEGLRTFGCLINGVPFVPTKTFSLYAGNSPLVVEYSSSSKFFRIIAQRFIDKDGQRQSTTAIFPSTIFSKEGVYDIITNTNGLQDTSSVCGTYKDLFYYTKFSKIIKGTMTITRFDPELRIVAGTFEYDAYSKECGDTTRITEGRFDVKL